MSSSPSIEISNLSKCYQIYRQPQDRLKQMVVPRVARLFGASPPAYFDEFWALRDVSLDVHVGDTFGIVGRNGSGKSTLLQLVAGTVAPSTGTISINGRVAAILELGSGFNPEFTGRENVRVSAGLFGISATDFESRWPSIESFADIGAFVDQPVKTYSSGMVMRLAFAVIAHVDADILIIDEALAVGDAFFTQKCMRFLRNFAKRGTIFFVSHDLQAVQSLCNRAAWLEKGQVKLVSDARAVSEAYLESLYGEQQAVSLSSSRGAAALAQEEDVRKDLLDSSNLRNTLEVFRFDINGPAFGAGGAQIIDVALVDNQHNRLLQIAGGEDVTLEITVRSIVDLQQPIVGFFVKDRLGQHLFGDNTFLTYFRAPQPMPAGTIFSARFRFRMPLLPVGDYFIAPAVADGTQENHVQHHWLHEAIMFRSVSSSVASGLVGVPMQQIEIARA